MRRPRYSDAAKADIHEILVYLRRQDAKAAAGRLVVRLRARCFALARRPGEGAPRDDLKPGLRFCPVGKYNIYYYSVATGIDVVAILHASLDQAAALERR